MFFNKLADTNHNIMCLVGNGFDMGAIDWLNENAPEVRDCGLGPAYSSSYGCFYEFICKHGNEDDFKDNIVFQEMKKAYDADDRPSDWADFEGIVDRLLFGNNEDKVVCLKDLANGTYIGENYIKKIEADLLQLQRMFSSFINELLPIEKMVKFDELVSEGAYAFYSLQAFLADLAHLEVSKEEDILAESKKIAFPITIHPHDKLNYMFVNFNYTALLDSYINLDRDQFKVNKFKTTNNNFDFLANPNNVFKNTNRTFNDNTLYQTRILTQVVHPHGTQTVPRSILFGTERADDDAKKTPFQKDQRWRLIKSLWARDEEKYLWDIKQTQLFIIYGMSISKTDGWWMTQIYRQLIKTDNPATLIIYNHVKAERTGDEARNAFIKSCIYRNEEEKGSSVEISAKKNIKVITYGDKRRSNVFLGFPAAPGQNRDNIKILVKEKEDFLQKKLSEL